MAEEPRVKSMAEGVRFLKSGRCPRPECNGPLVMEDLGTLVCKVCGTKYAKPEDRAWEEES